MSVAHLIYNVPSPEPSTWIKPSHLILTIIIPILQMRKLRPRDAADLLNDIKLVNDNARNRAERRRARRGWFKAKVNSGGNPPGSWSQQLGECLLSMDLAEGDWGSWGHQHLSASRTPNLDPVSAFYSVSFSGKCLSTAGPTLVCFQEVSLHLTKPSTSLKSLAHP